MERRRTYEWENPLNEMDRAKTLSGKEYFMAMLDGEFPLPPLLYTLGFEKPTLTSDEVIFPFQPQEYLYNTVGTVHGGVISAVLDSAMGCTLQSTLPAGYSFSTLELKVNFLKPIHSKTGKLLTKTKMIHKGKTIALLQSNICNDNGTVYAFGTSTCIIVKV